MKTLTQEQAMRLAENAGISGLVRYNWNAELIKTLNAAFALGVAQGIQQESELLIKCQTLMNELLLDEESSATKEQLDVGIEINKAIRARK